MDAAPTPTASLPSLEASSSTSAIPTWLRSPTVREACFGLAIIGLSAGVAWLISRSRREDSEVEAYIRALVGQLALDAPLSDKLTALQQLEAIVAEDVPHQCFRQMGGVEAVVRLLLSVDPALLPPLPVAASSTDAPTEESNTSASSEAISSDAASPAPAEESNTSTSSEAISSEAASPAPAEESNTSDGSEKVDGAAEGEEAAAVDAKEEKDGDDNSAPAASDTPDETSPEQLQHQLAHLAVQGAWICTGGRAVATDRLKLGTVEVIEHVTALFESDRTDIQTKECCVAFLACLVRNDRQFVPVVLGTRARSTLATAFMAATPDTNPALLARLTFALTPLLGHNIDKNNGVKALFHKGIVKHAFDLLDTAVQNAANEVAIVPLLEMLSELAGFADVATCRQILDRPLVATIVRVILKLLDANNWNQLADTLVTLSTFLSERTAPFRPTRQRFQSMFIETEGEVSEAAGRCTVSGFDVLLGALNLSIPPLAPYFLTIMFLLCEDNGSVRQAVRGNDIAMDTFTRLSESGHMGNKHAQELLALLSLHHTIGSQG